MKKSILLQADEAGRPILYEVTVEVRNLALKMLFASPPTLQVIANCVGVVFADASHVCAGMVTLVLSLKDQMPDDYLEVGDEIAFQEAGEQIGFITLQTRTLFA